LLILIFKSYNADFVIVVSGEYCPNEDRDKKNDNISVKSFIVLAAYVRAFGDVAVFEIVNPNRC